MLVAADRLAGDPVDVAEPVDPAADQHRMDGRGRQPEPATDLDRAEPLAPPQPHDLAHHVRSGSRCGHERGRLERSCHAAAPSARNRAAHLRAVGIETMNIFAAADGVQPSSTISRASRRRAFGVSAALAWDTKASWCVKRLLDSSTSQPEAFAYPATQAVSRNNVPGHHT